MTKNKHLGLKKANIRRTCRIMRVFLLFFMLGIGFCFSNNSYSQSTKISLNLKNKTVKQVFSEIEKNSEFIFFYQDDIIDVNRRVSVSADNGTIEQILDEVLSATGNTYFVSDRSIYIIKKTSDNIMHEEDVVQQQKKQITGTVTDKEGEAIIGANIVEKGTTNGTVTDVDGRFSLSVENDAVLQISYIGYLAQDINTVGKTTIEVVLQEDTKALEELVVVGYGTMEKRALTNSVSNISSEDFIAGTASPLMAIQGKIPGLSIVSTNGTDPNSGVSLQIRGVNSINGDQTPLVVVDGVPGADLELVAKEDIESISVLKDASAAAIYGTRATGGVVLITTKRPARGQAVINFSTELQIEKLEKSPDVLSADEFRKNGRTEVYGQNVYDYGSSTDWYKAVTKSAPFSQRYAISGSGGTETYGMSASGYLRKAEGIAINNDREEIGGRMNAYFKLFDNRLEISPTLNYTNVNLKSVDNSIFQMAASLNPTYPIYDVNSESGYYMILNQPYFNNPVAEVNLKDNSYRSTLMLANVSLRFNLTKDWFLSGMGAYKHVQAKSSSYISKLHRISLENHYDGSASHSYAESMDKTLELSSTYNHKFGAHNLDVVGGYSFQEFNGDSFSANNLDFLVDGLKEWDLGSGTYLTDGKAGMSSHKNATTRLIAFLGRVNYSYRDRYLATLNMRYEGSSKFYNNRWGTFPGISAGWRLSSEEFMNRYKNFLDDLKIRVSYGVTGNQGFDASVAYRMYNPDSWTYYNNQWIRVYGLKQNQNRDLKWETKKEFDIGLDFSFFDHRFSGRLDYYNRKIKDAIYSGIQVPSPPAVFPTSTVNIGTIKNSGFEFELSGTPIQTNDWTYRTSIVGNVLGKSRLEEMVTDTHLELYAIPHGGGSAVRIFGGQEIGQFYLFRFAGVREEDGTPMIYDNDGNMVPYSSRTDAIRVQTGRALPPLQLSWNNSINYRNWDFSAYFRSSIGNDIYNVTDMLQGINSKITTGQNVLRTAYERNAPITNTEELMLLDYWLEDGSFFKLDNITLGYSLPKGKIKYLNSVRGYLSMHNVFTLTKYSGLDPEVNINGLAPGFEDFGAYPRTRTFIFGIQVGL